MSAAHSDCVFCEIIAGKLPASPIYEDERILAFMDVQPVNAGHALVIPKMHAPTLADIPSDLLGHMAVIGQRVAVAIRATDLRCEGVNLFLADGEAAGQEVFHVHLHVFPRFVGDDFGLRFGPNYGLRPPRPELDAIASKIRSAMRG